MIAINSQSYIASNAALPCSIGCTLSAPVTVALGQRARIFSIMWDIDLPRFAFSPSDEENVGPVECVFQFRIDEALKSFPSGSTIERHSRHDIIILGRPETRGCATRTP